AGTAVRRFVAAGLRDLVAEQHRDSEAPQAAHIYATEHGFGRIAAGRRIDYVLASEDWQLERAWVAGGRAGRRYASDHWPVAARLTLA
ncbi:MAG TPA: hypothetical protein VJ787_09215, partial [Thermoleophilia bacterium]|nr:hypothetical protein [Thermoleophilia bacterium]